jgi:hypothetical protein
VVNCVRVLDAKRSSHAEEYGIPRSFCQVSRSDPYSSYSSPCPADIPHKGEFHGIILENRANITL